jgi:hypothetical protein
VRTLFWIFVGCERGLQCVGMEFLVCEGGFGCELIGD